VEIALAVVCGYLIGSIPIGLIVGRLVQGVDVRDYGSGKTGFTNTLRVLGLRKSAVVFLGDLVKGMAAALLPLVYTDEPWARALGGLAAIIGHIWPVFAGFRGGRGVLTGTGVLAALNPIVVLIVAPAALLVLAASRFMSLTSIFAATAAGLLFVVFAALDLHSWATATAAVIGALLVIAVHRDNIARLRAGVEPRIGQGGERRAPA
jgi:acyl phosphate:glycerol-3-phosphate acyltransferase